MQTVEFKKGNTLSITLPITDNAGNPLIGEVEKLTSQIRDLEDKLYADLVITESSVPGSYIFETSETNGFPIGFLYMDVKYDYTDEKSINSETIVINVLQAQTHG